MLDLKLGHRWGDVSPFMFGCWMKRLGDDASGSLSPSSAILILVLCGRLKHTFVSGQASGDQ
jgi:hypothetical protein